MSFEVRELRLDDDLETIGKLIYYTDPYIYTALFDNDINNAVKLASELVRSDTFYNYKNIRICLIDGRIAGYMTVLKKADNPTNRMNFEKVFKQCLGFLTPYFSKVMDDYFDLIVVHKGTNEVLSLSVLPEYRRMGVADALLDALDPKITYRLACIKANEAARKLYDKHGFKYDLDYPGYIGVPCVELQKDKMED